jgi:hypothetical protein
LKEVKPREPAASTWGPVPQAHELYAEGEDEITGTGWENEKVLVKEGLRMRRSFLC